MALQLMRAINYPHCLKVITSSLGVFTDRESERDHVLHFFFFSELLIKHASVFGIEC